MCINYRRYGRFLCTAQWCAVHARYALGAWLLWSGAKHLKLWIIINFRESLVNRF
jgi:hypothetical protein